MKESGGGVILNMASIAGSAGLPDRFAYSMSKGAVIAMTYSVARDYLRAQHPLQLHFAGASSHALCRRLSAKELSRTRAGDV